MQSFKSRELVTERYAWSHYYWYLTNEGIEYLREYLSLPAEIVPATLKKSTRPLNRTPGPEGGVSTHYLSFSQTHTFEMQNDLIHMPNVRNTYRKRQTPEP